MYLGSVTLSIGFFRSKKSYIFARFSADFRQESPQVVGNESPLFARKRIFKGAYSAPNRCRPPAESRRPHAGRSKYLGLRRLPHSYRAIFPSTDSRSRREESSPTCPHCAVPIVMSERQTPDKIIKRAAADVAPARLARTEFRPARGEASGRCAARDRRPLGGEDCAGPPEEPPPPEWPSR